MSGHGYATSLPHTSRPPSPHPLDHPSNPSDPPPTPHTLTPKYMFIHFSTCALGTDGRAHENLALNTHLVLSLKVRGLGGCFWPRPVPLAMSLSLSRAKAFAWSSANAPTYNRASLFGPSYLTIHWKRFAPLIFTFSLRWTARAAAFKLGFPPLNKVNSQGSRIRTRLSTFGKGEQPGKLHLN